MTAIFRSVRLRNHPIIQAWIKDGGEIREMYGTAESMQVAQGLRAYLEKYAEEHPEPGPR